MDGGEFGREDNLDGLKLMLRANQVGALPASLLHLQRAVHANREWSVMHSHVLVLLHRTTRRELCCVLTIVLVNTRTGR
jgi:hypothetical protein